MRSVHHKIVEQKVTKSHLIHDTSNLVTTQLTVLTISTFNSINKYFNTDLAFALIYFEQIKHTTK